MNVTPLDLGTQAGAQLLLHLVESLDQLGEAAVCVAGRKYQPQCRCVRLGRGVGLLKRSASTLSGSVIKQIRGRLPGIHVEQSADSI